MNGIEPAKRNAPGPTTLVAALLAALALSQTVSRGHDEHLHEELSRSAFRSSDGLKVFLSDSLGAAHAPFEAAPILKTRASDEPPSLQRSPMNWLSYGSYQEDMSDPEIYGKHFLRGTDHFYTPLQNPKRLTDWSELHFLFWDLAVSYNTDSFTWGTDPAAIGPAIPLLNKWVGANGNTWHDARYCQYYAQILPFKTDREAMLALTLYALGHVVHLTQDLSQPEHTRDDEHAFHRAIEKYGYKLYLDAQKMSPAERANVFPLRRHGWQYWRQAGFTKVQDFWNRGKYTGQAQALNNDKYLDRDAVPGEKLGLAELTSGNFLGYDSRYGEEYIAGTKEYTLHHFPFPSITSSTDFRAVAVNIFAHARDYLYPDGTLAKRVYLHKNADGIEVLNHSRLTYLGVKLSKKNGAALVPRTTIDDSNVLREYHSTLIPKAIEYSAGILDYFFHGRLQVGASWDSTQYRLHIVNLSGQALLGGTWTLLKEDSNGDRTQIPLTLSWTETSTLADLAAIEATLAGPPLPQDTKCILVYRGTIGASGSPAKAIDDVDKEIAIAAKTFTLTTGCVDWSQVTWTPPNVLGASICSFYGGNFTISINAALATPAWVADAVGSVHYTGPSCTAKITVELNSDNGAVQGDSGLEILQDGGYAARVQLGDYLGLAPAFITIPFTIRAGVNSLIQIKGAGGLPHRFYALYEGQGFPCVLDYAASLQANTPVLLPDGQVGAAYSAATTSPTGLSGLVAWELSTGALPSGLTLDRNTGELSGTPTTPGAYLFTIVARGATGFPRWVAASFSLSIPLPGGEVGVAYSSATVSGDGLTLPVVWSVMAGTLPPGLSVDPNTGQLTGTPTTAGTYAFTVLATGGSGEYRAMSHRLTVAQ